MYPLLRDFKRNCVLLTTWFLLIIVSVLGLCTLWTTSSGNLLPPSAYTPPLSSRLPLPPTPEPITIIRLTLPPVVQSDAVGACSLVNPHGTGCIPIDSELQSGNFLPDNKHIVAMVNFAGAPAAPDRAHIFTGKQIMLVKTDGSRFPTGASWKCITCGVPAENQPARNDALDYPQAFKDGKRILTGTNIIDCGSELLSSPQCTPEKVHIYPIRWNNLADGSGPGGAMRELRVHPDDVHIGYSSFVISNGNVGQFCYFGRLEFHPSPTSGTPLSARYDIINVTILFDPTALAPITIEGSEIKFHPEAIAVGELRGFSGRGNEITYIGYPHESSNIDVFAVDLTTGTIRRLTSHPEYVDPVDISPDDNWTMVMDTRGTNRQMWVAGMRGIPPVTDMISTAVTASTRNNGRRRFFIPWLIDRYGDRGSYSGQRLNAAGDGSPGSINDPEWNGRADPKWSNDGTQIVYTEELTISPACGGANPLPCYNSTEPGGRIQRVMLAQLTSRTPLDLSLVLPRSDVVPWGTPYRPGSSIPTRPILPQGIYSLQGKASGSAKVNITHDALGASIRTVALDYNNLSDDGINFLNGTEKVTVYSNLGSSTSLHTDWYSDLVRTGISTITKKTGSTGFHLDIDIMVNLFEANGTLTTVVDGVIYEQPLNGA